MLRSTSKLGKAEQNPDDMSNPRKPLASKLESELQNQSLGSLRKFRF